MRVLAISGSTRAGSHNASLLRAFARQLPDDTTVEMLDPALLRGVPAYDQDLQPALEHGPELVAIRAAVADADVVVFATPEYNGSIPGQLKNVLDWVSRPLATNPFQGKPVAVLSAGPGQFGAVWANEDLRKVLGVMGARVLERQVAVPAVDTVFAADGSIASTGVARQLQRLATDVVGAAGETTPRPAAIGA